MDLVDPYLWKEGPSFHQGAPASLLAPSHEALGDPCSLLGQDAAAYLVLACLVAPSCPEAVPGEAEVQTVAPFVQA